MSEADVLSQMHLYPHMITSQNETVGPGLQGEISHSQTELDIMSIVGRHSPFAGIGRKGNHDSYDCFSSEREKYHYI